MIRWLLVLPVGLLLLSLNAQPRYRPGDYLSNGAGDTLQLRYALPASKANQPMLITFEASENGASREVLNGNTYQLFRLDSMQGWVILQMGEVEGLAHMLEKPLIVLPFEVAQGEAFSSQSAYTTTSQDGRRLGGGQVSVSARIQGHDSTASHLRNFGDCLVVHSTIEYQQSNGLVVGQELKQWYARGIGLVKVAGTRYKKNSSGRIIFSERLAAMLEKAIIGGKRL